MHLSSTRVSKQSSAIDISWPNTRTHESQNPCPQERMCSGGRFKQHKQVIVDRTLHQDFVFSVTLLVYMVVIRVPGSAAVFERLLKRLAMKSHATDASCALAETRANCADKGARSTWSKYKSGSNSVAISGPTIVT